MGAAKKKSSTKFVVEGELTIYTAAETREKFAALLQTEQPIEIDLSQVSEIDTAGLQLLLLARREAAAREKTLTFSDPSAAVQNCWQLCNFETAHVSPAQIISAGGNDDATSA
jgi:anti-sigma B factor antagonist